ncbi:colanic acid biosynthesis glycosyl transferase WcaI [Devosia sp. YR412]|uniref:WcaI family glycosyltransferase n=1 Tax=Devosia sp. YR412 TaxID=1881030 RepID=UPI0008B6B764|nr:WcaI family glycosyltransferase [Devosia sp. YR412]SEQ53569.1 colanic acid biosynthesis glycosyl transferase WcaI [Devosia sp. YR412]
MKLLILGLNYAPEKIGIAVYTTGMAEALAGMGHEVQVIAGRPYYPAWKIMEGHSALTYGRSIEEGVDVTRAPHYIPKQPSGLKRLLHHSSFAASTFFPMLWRALTWRPDVVITIAPSLIAAPVAALAARASGARSWLHIQDFEVEAAFVTGLLNKDSGVGRTAEKFELRLLRQFDTVSSISPQMCAKLIEKGVSGDRVLEFRNWSDLDVIRPLAAPSTYRTEWNITTHHVALYSGNIANKQGIEIVVDAARRLKHRTDLTFVVCGEGPNRANLEAQAADLGNVRFHGLQPKERLSDLLGLASIHLLPQIAGAADLVLPSKLTNMLASGRPVVATALQGTGLYDEVEGCGLIVAPEDGKALSGAIATLLDDSALSTAYGKAARQRAEQRWSKRAIMAGLEKRLHKASSATQPATGTAES